MKSVKPTIDLKGLALDGGGYLLIEHELAGLPAGTQLHVTGRDPALDVNLAGWCRSRAHTLIRDEDHLTVVSGDAEGQRWTGSERAGRSSPEGMLEHAEPRWGLAARGALVEAGGPLLNADLTERDYVWTDVAPRLYALAAANQWDPATAVGWQAGTELPQDIESVVVQIMTFLIENEQAALIIPARMLARMHPYFREVMQILAIQTADEARHIEIFTRRALLRGETLGVSGAGGRASLQSMLDEPDFAMSAFLLSVLGEGTFLDLLGFLQNHAPDPVTADVARLALRDERRHVAFGVSHVAHTARTNPGFLNMLRNAVERRHDVLAGTSGLNQSVFDALVTLAAGSWTPEAIASGWKEVQSLQARMDEGRRRRLSVIGFPDDEAAEISDLHTRNFM